MEIDRVSLLFLVIAAEMELKRTDLDEDYRENVSHSVDVGRAALKIKPYNHAN